MILEWFWRSNVLGMVGLPVGTTGQDMDPVDVRVRVKPLAHREPTQLDEEKDWSGRAVERGKDEL